MYQMFALTGLAVTIAVSGIAILRNKKGKTVLPAWVENTGRFIDRYYIIFLFLIFAVFLASRLLKLDSFPNGFHVDELSMAADAKSILFNGTERWGYRYPPYFQNAGGGQNALYIYIQAFLLSFLTCTIFTFRIQAVFWGAVGFFAIFAICRELIGNRGYALMGPALATTLPVYIMSERWGLEAYIFLPFCAIVMYLMIRAIKYEKTVDWILTGVFMGASLYTYAVSYVIWPICLLLTGIYLIYIKKVSFKNVVLFAIPLAILAFPLILFQLVNLGVIEPMSFGISDYIPLPEARQKDLGFENIIPNIAFFKDLFLGGEPLTYNVLPEFGTVYMFLIPFVVIGMVYCIKDTVTAIKNREFSISAPIVFFWFAGMVCMMLLKGPNINRVNEIFLPFVIFIVVAVYRLFSKNAATLVWLGGWLAASFLFFMYFYFFIQNSVYGFHMLYTSASPGKAIIRSQESYVKDENTHIYVLFDYRTINPTQQIWYFAAKPGEVYSDDDVTYGNVTGELPENIDINENAVYIVSNDWPHIVSYFISEGFAADQSLPEYSILFRP